MCAQLYAPNPGLTLILPPGLQVAHSPYSSAMDCVRQVLAREGLSAFYKSYWITLVMNVPFTALHFSVYESAKKVQCLASPHVTSPHPTPPRPTPPQGTRHHASPHLTSPRPTPPQGSRHHASPQCGTVATAHHRPPYLPHTPCLYTLIACQVPRDIYTFSGDACVSAPQVLMPSHAPLIPKSLKP